MEKRTSAKCSRCGLAQYPTAANRCRGCWKQNGVVVPLAVDPPLTVCEVQPVAPASPIEAMNFAEALRYWRQVWGMTHTQLSTHMKRGNSFRCQIDRWEHTHHVPEIKSILLMAHGLGIPVEWLLTPWPVDGMSRQILRSASGLTAAGRQGLLEKVRVMVAGRA